MRLIQNKPLTPSAIALCETINMDLDSETISRPRGRIAYSHNYPYLLKLLNYDIFRQEVISIDPNIPFYSVVVMVATTKSVKPPVVWTLS